MTDPDDPLALAPLFEGGGEPWLPLLRPAIERQAEAAQFIGPGRDKAVVPVRELTFQALKPNPPGRWRVVVFGQNPYPRVESATGIAMFDNSFVDWSDPRFGKVTSIRCIIKAACMHKLQVEKSTSTAQLRTLLSQHDIVDPPGWFQAMLGQGVLLLNAALTASSDGSLATARHTKFWKPVIETIIAEILRAKAAASEGVVFAWWGSHAKALRTLVERLEQRHLGAKVRHVDHCNPAAMGDAFCDVDHFGQINQALLALRAQPVDWLPSRGWNLGASHDQAEQQRLGAFIDRTRELHKLYLERLQGVGEEQLVELPAIEGIMHLPAPTLSDALGPLIERWPALGFYLAKAREFASKAGPKAGSLSEHEIGALFLYTCESVLYKQLNAILRDPDRSSVLIWRPYLRLFISAVAGLDHHPVSLWRGVATDLRAAYPTGRRVTWWGISSCTSNPAVARAFLGSKGHRTLFEVNPRRAVSIRAFSAFQAEDEYVLAPGTQLAVTQVQHQKDGLTLVRLSEVDGDRLVG